MTKWDRPPPPSPTQILGLQFIYVHVYGDVGPGEDGHHQRQEGGAGRGRDKQGAERGGGGGRGGVSGRAEGPGGGGAEAHRLASQRQPILIVLYSGSQKVLNSTLYRKKTAAQDIIFRSCGSFLRPRSFRKLITLLIIFRSCGSFLRPRSFLKTYYTVNS
jgi:hypothetical protein